MPHFPLLRRVATLVAAGVLLVACGGGSEEARPTATLVPERTSSSSTTTTLDLAPPDPIDAAYLDRVMDRADDLLQAAFAEGGDLQTALDSVYTAGQASKLTRQVEALGAGGVADPPGLPTTKVRDVVSAGPDCVFFTAERDLTPLVAKSFPQVQPYWIQLVPEPTDADFPWRLASDTFYADGSAPANACP